MSDQLDSVSSFNIEDYTDINQLTHFWADDGLPIFVADVENVIDIAKHLGFSIFYVMGNTKEYSTQSNTTTSTNTTTSNSAPKTTTTSYVPSKETFRTQIFKVVNNIVGHSVTPTKDVSVSYFDTYKQEAFYTMPPIPRVIVNKLDEFFRTVDAAHGTEAIVLLTFDTTKEDSSGWGVLVPDQQNTSAHCNYDPLSIVDAKPDHVLIVGSVHSHPHMAAYASGTDHKDQADFDGLHITFGWQESVNNGSTQYHIEMQMSGSTYTLKPKDVFEQYTISTEPDPEVLEWTGKVKKALPPTSWGVTHTAPAQTRTTQTPKVTTPKTHTASSDSLAKVSSDPVIEDFANKYYYEIRPDLSLDSLGLVIGEVDPLYNGLTTEHFCPCCEAVVDSDDLWSGYCWSCDIPICLQNESMSIIYDILHNYSFARNIVLKDHPIYLWGINNNTNEEFFIVIQESSKKNSSYYGDINYSNETVYDKYLDFQSETNLVDVYAPNIICESCSNYYGYSCPVYRDLASKYNFDNPLPVSNYRHAINLDNCEYFEAYEHTRSSYYEEV
jgi:hypothetical protein